MTNRQPEPTNVGAEPSAFLQPVPKRPVNTWPIASLPGKLLSPAATTRLMLSPPSPFQSFDYEPSG